MSWKEFIKLNKLKMKLFFFFLAIVSIPFLISHNILSPQLLMKNQVIYRTIFDPIFFLKDTIFLFGLGNWLIILSSIVIPSLLGFLFLGFPGAELLGIILHLVVSTLFSILYLYFFSCLVVWIYNKIRKNSTLKNLCVYFLNLKINILTLSLFFVIYYLYFSYMLNYCLTLPFHSLPFYCKSRMVPLVFVIAYMISRSIFWIYDKVKKK
jgi:hypothetical protein